MSEIEESFFETFNIKPKCDLPCQKRGVECVDNTYCGNKYPEITSDILLKLICILNDFEGIDVKATTPEELKEELLKQCIEPFEYPIAFEERQEIDKLYNQVQSLFTEAGE